MTLDDNESNRLICPSQLARLAWHFQRTLSIGVAMINAKWNVFAARKYFR